MKFTRLVAGSCVGLLLGVVIGFLIGYRQGRFLGALDENKVALVNLRYHSESLTPQLREYLKARVYSNVLAFYPSRAGYLRQGDWDCGPVDGTIIRDLNVAKDPGWRAVDWGTAIKDK